MAFYKFYVVLLLFVQVIFYDKVYGHCSWNVNKDLPGRLQPLYFQISNNRPHINLDFTNGLRLDRDEELYLGCPGTKNHIKGRTGVKEMVVSCASGKDVNVEGKTANLKSLECKDRVVGDAVKRNRQCATSRGKIFQIGFSTNKGWINLFDVCYNETYVAPLYSEHTIVGSGIRNAFKGGDRISFKTVRELSRIPFDSIYGDRKRQFISLLGERNGLNIYQSPIAKGHLAPVKDFILPTYQLSTMYYINAVPQWQASNGANWVSVENLVRKIAEKSRGDVRVITGVHKVLHLNDGFGKAKKISLAPNDAVPIPKWIWKIVYLQSQGKGIAFVQSNDPFNDVDSHNLLCRDVCAEYNWNRDKWNEFRKGYTFCCEVDDLLNNVNMHSLVRTSETLSGHLYA